jgi:hypothetical protein
MDSDSLYKRRHRQRQILYSKLLICKRMAYVVLANENMILIMYTVIEIDRGSAV